MSEGKVILQVNKSKSKKTISLRLELPKRAHAILNRYQEKVKDGRYSLAECAIEIISNARF